jgi:Tfp pilus assembly protein PilO
VLTYSNNKIVIFLVIVSFLILGIVYINWLFPVHKAIREINKDISYEEQLIDTYKNKINKTDIHDNPDELLTQVPKNPDVDKLLIIIKNAETTSNSSILSIEAINQIGGEALQIEKELPNGVRPITYRLVVASTDYPSLTIFLNTIDQSERIISIVSTRILSDNGYSMNEGDVQAEIVITSYYIVE